MRDLCRCASSRKGAHATKNFQFLFARALEKNIRGAFNLQEVLTDFGMSFGNPVSGSLSPGNAMTKLADSSSICHLPTCRDRGILLKALIALPTINILCITPALALDPPTFNLNSGTYTARPSLVITPAPGAVAKYTLDGSSVTTSSTSYTPALFMGVIPK